MGERCRQNFAQSLFFKLFFQTSNFKLVCKWRQLHEFLFYDLDLFDIVKLIFSIVDKFNGGRSRITDMPNFTVLPIIIIWILKTHTELTFGSTIEGLLSSPITKINITFQYNCCVPCLIKILLQYTVSIFDPIVESAFRSTVRR
jgi:hypothetical protein